MEQWYARISTSGRFDCVLLLCFQSIASVTREPLPEHELRGDAAKDRRTEWIIFLRLQCVSANGCATHYCTHIPFSWCKPVFCLPFYPYTTCAVLNIFNVHAWMMWTIHQAAYLHPAGCGVNLGMRGLESMGTFIYRTATAVDQNDILEALSAKMQHSRQVAETFRLMGLAESMYEWTRGGGGGLPPSSGQLWCCWGAALIS